MKHTIACTIILLAACAPDPQEAEVQEQEAHPDELEPPPLDELWDTEITADTATVPDDVLAEGAGTIGTSGDASKRIVGDDNRKPVPNTRVSPYASIVALYPQFPSAAKPSLCSGVLIAPDAVLTAGHCVFDARRGGYAKTTRVVPAAYTDAAGKPSAPFGSTYAISGHVTDEFRAVREEWASYGLDYGVIRLKHPIGSTTGVRKVGVMPGNLLDRVVKLVGYHGDKFSGSATALWTARAVAMQTSQDKVRKVYGGNFNHFADSKPGSSGSPLFSDGAFSDTVFAIHIAGPETPEGNPFNIGVIITEDMRDTIEEWTR